MKNKEPCQKKPNQSNHENTVIPESVSQYAKQPLYIIIALWCQQQNRWINHNDIARAFSMSVRRATFQLSYMTRRPKYVLFRSRQQVVVGKARRYTCNEIWVDKVITESEVHEMENRAPPTDIKSERKMGAYRSRVGNGMSGSENIWHKLIILRHTKQEQEGEDE
ncbi:CaiF/GrlA family transcriptional regulator [Salmonella enterica subsp. enterica serovar Adelaide]|uniref:CaiF/GrlA family transcriptional regulator n=1 Tax=Salmonella enterica TaxID=28901 RepID=UPI0009AE183A|nr:CaiF/GrlA family transcriptional regulator [Salmonella enterica]EBO4428094.1 CaiF/GrlA family transcriptional regulator [Salmonella enterica subsp. enterica]EBV2307623.1 CaiF/GrlA family transcriptional regulator [Salmonella enterica subsp. enterica serovar Reading]ECV3497083.1 CaiF/GrlA family transcriptional regulator [Salmonella enterica subsp. enterica serovar Derby]EDX9403907.1 CaiF/GrlA family transcriptional regulator [Salmonella enterica subsp. enterica serovar Nottingham]HCA3578468